MRKRHDLAALIEVEHLWIPLRDGTRLAARLWRPADGEAVPGVMEYVPYRKGEATAIDDSIRQRYLAAHGFACLRVDVRGAGESDGVLADEYTAQELADGCDVIAWLAQQPWCSGRVGLMGISWGGFNALQIAALRPPALGAVISACSTDDLGSPEGAPPLDYEVVDGRLKLPDGLESWAQNRDEHSLESDPLSARVDCHRLYGLERDDWQTHVEIDAHMTCDADRFHVETRLQAYEGDTRVHERAWNSSTPRNLR